jgi:hypothetical protein
MAITLGAITLPAGLIWSNEYEWTGIARAIEPSVTGVPMIQATPLVSGREITFTATHAWISRTDLDALVELVAVDSSHTLTLHDGRTVDVQFRDPPFAAQQLVEFEAPEPGDFYVLNQLNLITVGAMNPPPAPEE